MSEITEKLENIKEIQDYLENLKQKINPITILGLSDVSKSCITALTEKKEKQNILLITYNELVAQNLHKNLKKIIKNVTYIPKKDIITYEYDAQSMDILYQRLEGIKKLYEGENTIIIVSTETIMQPILTKKTMQNSILKIMCANEYNIEEIKAKLVSLGYERCDIVEGKGTFSVRGDILDIGTEAKKGIRIEFFGDEVDQIRCFETSSQRSTETLNQAKIYPLSEEIEKEPKGSIIEYLQEKDWVIIDEINKVELRADSIQKDNKLLIKDLIEKDKNVPYILEHMYTKEEIQSKINKYKIIHLESQDIIKSRENKISIKQEEIKQIEKFFYEITKQEKEKQTYKPRTRRTSEFKEAEKITFSNLKIGDYVVHRTNGIGQYIGVNTIKTEGITKDYIKIKYTGEDILYIPTNSLDNVRKYIGGGEKAPKINKLGGKDWENTKNKVKSNLREVARNLIELYAARQKVKGYAFEKDTPWQKEFEETFPYIETEDQLRCIEEVKQDMERSKPMDRLLCGDVGYGKTEVAIRAAFKACMSGKQVAYLVPTTILANQQYESFKERMNKFAIKVELLNRFRSKKEQTEIIKKLKLGEIDIIIGTHRILSKDVEFKNLGFLIIDEEHRFGVKDKEKIKEMKNNIDVLTMTATPIPRTLHMSIVGVRDMSVIYEPPQDRKPVRTYVLEYDSEVVREAITKELERYGQVFYLYNKVEGIEKKAKQVSELVPEAKVAYAHGKMSGEELEDIMQDFIEKKIDIIVCTTILESGIDIPNANTIIVENADRLGLAQLYQIRGRVRKKLKRRVCIYNI
ncbi:MAG: DEAD/DEAH box helicase [Clostridia bacterium]|nr:DEAD/DEAH box helicase [Clostridia bacterium]